MGRFLSKRHVAEPTPTYIVRTYVVRTYLLRVKPARTGTSGQPLAATSSISSRSVRTGTPVPPLDQ